MRDEPREKQVSREKHKSKKNLNGSRCIKDGCQISDLATSRW